jgi:hypothetical protein
VEIQARKADKKHETRGRAMNLLVYIDGVLHPPRMPPSWAELVLQEVGPGHKWSSIWLYDDIYDRIVASWHKTEIAAQQAAGVDR